MKRDINKLLTSYGYKLKSAFNNHFVYENAKFERIEFDDKANVMIFNEFDRKYHTKVPIQYTEQELLTKLVTGTYSKTGEYFESVLREQVEQIAIKYPVLRDCIDGFDKNLNELSMYEFLPELVDVIESDCLLNPEITPMQDSQLRAAHLELFNLSEDYGIL